MDVTAYIIHGLIYLEDTSRIMQRKSDGFLSFFSHVVSSKLSCHWYRAVGGEFGEKKEFINSKSVVKMMYTEENQVHQNPIRLPQRL